MIERPAELALVLTTVPDAATAQRVGGQLAEERLIAGASVRPGVTSISRWPGEVETAAEVIVLMKTPPERVDALIRRCAELHPYDVPEIIALPVAAGLEAYCRWAAEETAEVTA
jgi:periplasmic divalent cation tolerance protein